MSMAPIGGIVGSAAGAPLSQTQGASAERARQEATATERTAEADRRAEGAAGIGRMEGDQQTNDRDADGRRAWEVAEEQRRQQDAAEEERAQRRPPSLDGSGGALDLTG